MTKPIDNIERWFTEQNKDAEMKARFTKVAKELKENEATIVSELLSAQGKPSNIDGYF